MSSHRQALYSLSAGRLVPRRGWKDSLDPRRCALAIGVIVLLCATNPSNWERADALTTNYGVFRLQEYGNRLVFSVAYLDIECHFQSILEQRQGLRDVCTSLRRSMAHLKPLVWDPNDLAHVLHRTCTIILIFMTVLALCQRKYVSSFRCGSIVIDAFTSLLVQYPQRPLMGLVWCLFLENIFIHPILKVLCNLVPAQVDSSWFRLFDQDGADISLTVFTLLGLVVLVNAFGYHFWHRKYWLQFDGVLAVMLGYYRGLFGNRPPDYSLQWLHTLLRTSSLPATVSVKAVTWTFILLLGFDSFPKSIAFMAVNLAGAQLGYYQYQHLGTQGAIQKLMDGIAKLFGAT